MDDIKNIIESLLFVAEEPLTVDRFKKMLDADGTEEIRAALRTLIDEYDTRNGGFYLREVAGGYQLRTRREYNQWVKKLLQPKPPRLSKAALETLAIVAYKQPVIRSSIEHIRGVDCGGLLRMLLERHLIRVLGRKEIPGRPLIYGTTRRFLEVFDLKDLKDLPTPKEIEELNGPGDDQPPTPDVDREPGEAEQPTDDYRTPTGGAERHPAGEDSPNTAPAGAPGSEKPDTDSTGPPVPDHSENGISQ